MVASVPFQKCSSLSALDHSEKEDTGNPRQAQAEEVSDAAGQEVPSATVKNIQDFIEALDTAVEAGWTSTCPYHQPILDIFQQDPHLERLGDQMRQFAASEPS